MKRKQYLYAISYWCTDKEGRSGQSCSLITRPSKINTVLDFNNMFGTNIEVYLSDKFDNHPIEYLKVLDFPLHLFFVS